MATDEKYAYLYAKEELEEWVPRIWKMALEAGEVHLIFKNKGGDAAVVNARQMQGLLGILSSQEFAPAGSS